LAKAQAIICALKFPEVWRGRICGNAFTKSQLTRPCEQTIMR
jgi:hypothetical protein